MINGLLIFALAIFVVIYWRWQALQNWLWNKKYKNKI